MALTIPPAFCTDQPYPFSILRKQMASLTSAGIVHPGDMAVSPASGLQVQIAAGEVYVQQTGATEGSEYNGLYYELNDAPSNPFNTISAPLVDPRIDFIVLRVYDVTELGISGSSFARFEWVQGSENASASLSTMGPGLSNPGEPTLPTSSLLLAYVLQTVGESSISGGNILNVAPQAGVRASGILAQRPLIAPIGATYFSTDTQHWFVSNGTNWDAVDIGPSRGAVNIPTSETRTNSSLGLMPTPDQVSGLVLPTNGLIAVWYQATWLETVSNAGAAEIQLNGTAAQLTENNGSIGQGTAFIGGSGAAGHKVPLATYAGGLRSPQATTTDSVADASTGQYIGQADQIAGTGNMGGPAYIAAAAGTYTVSVVFRASSGSVTVSSRRLWAQVIPFA